jgi:excisionase family DNA binding protein
VKSIEDIELIKSIIRAEIFENINNDEERLLSKKEIATYLSISVKTIDKMVFYDEIPYLKVGRLVRFEKDKVLAWAKDAANRR